MINLTLPIKLFIKVNTISKFISQLHTFVTSFLFLCAINFKSEIMDVFLENKILFRKIKSGDKKAFEHLYARYYYRLRGYAAKFIQDNDVVDDVIQESFMILWEKKEKLSDVSVSSLLFTIVRNNCLNYLKHKAIMTKYTSAQCLDTHEVERLYYFDFGLDASHKLLHDELQEHIEMVIRELPGRCREVFQLSRHNGLKNREIALSLNISTTAVEKHIKKALNTFNEYFKTKYPIDITYF